VVRRPGASIDADGVRSFVASRLARHKVPRDVTFVDELPRNTTGKLLRG
jgi:fatty-acyl-CoA synthase